MDCTSSCYLQIIGLMDQTDWLVSSAPHTHCNLCTTSVRTHHMGIHPDGAGHVARCSASWQRLSLDVCGRGVIQMHGWWQWTGVYMPCSCCVCNCRNPFKGTNNTTNAAQLCTMHVVVAHLCWNGIKTGLTSPPYHLSVVSWKAIQKQIALQRSSLDVRLHLP